MFCTTIIGDRRSLRVLHVIHMRNTQSNEMSVVNKSRKKLNKRHGRRSRTKTKKPTHRGWLSCSVIDRVPSYGNAYLGHNYNLKLPNPLIQFVVAYPRFVSWWTLLQVSYVCPHRWCIHSFTWTFKCINNSYSSPPQKKQLLLLYLSNVLFLK
jgi:hypothetical protein